MASKKIQLYLPLPLMANIENESKKSGLSTNEIIRVAISEYFKMQDQTELLKQMLKNRSLEQHGK